MSNYDEDGFLGGKIYSWMDENVVSHQELFDLAHKLNRDCNRLLENKSQNVNEKLQGASLALFAGMVEIFQAIILVSKRGMTESTQTLLRSFLEKLFHFTALQKKPSYLKEYENQFQIARLESAKKISKSDSSHFSEEKKKIDDENLIEKIKQQISDIGAIKVTIREVSERAGLHDLYVGVYDPLSRIAHSGVSALDPYLSFIDKETGELPKLTYGPSDRETRFAICFIGMYLPQAGISVAQFFDNNPKVDHFSDFSNSFKNLLNTN